MTKEQLKKARNIDAEIWQTEKDIEDIDKILNDYSNFGSDITFRRNSDSFSRSFGSKKNDFRENLEKLLKDLRFQKNKQLKELNNEFKKI